MLRTICLYLSFPSKWEEKRETIFEMLDVKIISEDKDRDNVVARTATIYKTGFGLTTGFSGSHTVTHNCSVYTLHSQFTIVLAESSYNYK
jgi:hypothetical protein